MPLAAMALAATLAPVKEGEPSLEPGEVKLLQQGEIHLEGDEDE
jgi:hypothetical protein